MHMMFIVWLAILSLLVLIILYYIWQVGDPQKLVNIGSELIMTEINKLKEHSGLGREVR